MLSVYSRLFTIVLLLSSIISYSQSKFALPDDTIGMVNHKYFMIKYDCEKKIPKWNAYALDSSMLVVNASRSTFYADEKTGCKNATNSDYYKSGYDKGHMVPDADMSFSETATYLFSNVTLQDPSFNRGVWLALEKQVRRWSYTDTLYICTGPILLSNKYNTIGLGNVAVPDYFFKAIRKKNTTIAFVIPNKYSYPSFGSYVVSVDFVEALTGMNFFCNFKDQSSEEKLNIEDWFN